MCKKIFACIVALFLMSVAAIAAAQTLTPIEKLGKSIFNDTTLSINQNLSCAGCHGPEAGWTGPESSINEAGAVYEGSIPGRFGNRKPPSAAYATQSPILYYSRQAGGMFIGGNFWDGRATGEKLGNPAADQAQGPFLNPLEQALSNPASVVYRVVCNTSYPVSFEDVWGLSCSDIAEDTIALAYDAIALSIAAYEASSEVNQFSSKYDRYLTDHIKLSQDEKKGLQLFNGKAKCARCHINKKGSKGELPLLTDYTYDNLGVPKNPENPFYGQTDFNPLGDAWVDWGLGGFLETRPDYTDYANSNYGKQKVPTLRNVDKRPDSDFVKAYAHNGYFKSLEGIVHFYNTRDVLPICDDDLTEAEALADNCWPPPEVAINVNTQELGDLGLTEEEEYYLVAYLKTLSDGYTP